MKNLITLTLLIIGLLSCKKEELKPIQQTTQPISSTLRTAKIEVYTRDTITNKVLFEDKYLTYYIKKNNENREYKNRELIECVVGDTINLIAGLGLNPWMTDNSKHISYKFFVSSDINYAGDTPKEQDSLNFHTNGFIKKSFIIK